MSEQSYESKMKNIQHGPQGYSAEKMLAYTVGHRDARHAAAEHAAQADARIAELEAALEHITAVMGPKVPSCSGCTYEWETALKTARAALGPKA